MRNVNRFSTDFIIGKCREDKSKARAFFVRVTVNGKRVEISLNEKINTADLDNKYELVKGDTGPIKAFNEYIGSVRHNLKTKYRTLQEAKEEVTADAVKCAFLGIYSLQRGKKLNQLCEYFSKIWKSKLKPGTFKNYETTFSYLRNFIAKEYGAREVYLGELNIAFATNFEHHIRTCP